MFCHHDTVVASGGVRASKNMAGRARDHKTSAIISQGFSKYVLC